MHFQGNRAVGLSILASANSKAGLAIPQALMLGVLANVLVCLAVWLCYSARTTTDKILAIVPPVSLFVAANFEHSVANMFILPFGLLIKEWAPQEYWVLIGQSPASYAALDWASFFSNLLPVTIGNIIGGGVLVGAVYWFVYLRKRRQHN